MSINLLYQEIKNQELKDKADGINDQDYIQSIIAEVREKHFFDQMNIGAVEFGLPRPAVPYKSLEMEILKKKVQLIGKVAFGQNKFAHLGRKSANIPAEETKTDERTTTTVPTEAVPIEKPIENKSKEKQTPEHSKPLNQRPLPKIEINVRKEKQAEQPIKKEPAPVPITSEQDLQHVEEEDAIRRRERILAALEKRETGDHSEKNE